MDQGKVLKKIRLKLGLTQVELGRVIGLNSGTSSDAQYISNIERGLCVFPYGRLKHLNKVANVRYLCSAMVEDYRRQLKEELVSRLD